MTDSKVNPVEAQAVPDQPVARVVWFRDQGANFNKIAFLLQDVPVDSHLFTRPTPAAADLHQQIINLKYAQGFSETTQSSSWRDGYIVGHRDARHAAAQLVAASPAAAAGVPTGWKLVAVEPTDEMFEGFRSVNCTTGDPAIGMGEFTRFHGDYGNWLACYQSMLAASPVAPVGAPTVSDEREALRELVEADKAHNIAQGTEDGDVRWKAIKRLSAAYERARALLSAQGCELATDATKQLGEPSVHLAVNDAAEDFRRRPASSEAAPSAWIPVSERLPEKTCECLCYYPPHAIADLGITTDEFHADTGLFYYGGSGMTPSHWMPVPTAPKAVPDQPVAWMYTRAEDGRKVLDFAPNPNSAGTWKPLFTRPTPAAADLHQQIHSDHLAVNDAEEDFRMRPASSEAAPSAEGWHAPGLGEVHNADHSVMIDVLVDNPAAADDDPQTYEPDYLPSDVLAERLAALLNSNPGLLLAAPRQVAHSSQAQGQLSVKEQK